MTNTVEQKPITYTVYGEEALKVSTGDYSYAFILGENKEANARLIAAAPELLEACSAMVQEAQSVHALETFTASEVISRLGAIVAKAEGRA